MIRYKKQLLYFLIVLLLTETGRSQPTSTPYFDIRFYGATGDGKTVNTKAINDAIDAAEKAGGGTVLFPAGTYLSYSVHLKSNISLYLDQGCMLVAADSTSGGQYDSPEPAVNDKYQDYGHSHFHNSFIWGEQLQNISILGPGVIYGKGLSRSFYANEGWERKVSIPAYI